MNPSEFEAFLRQPPTSDATPDTSALTVAAALSGLDESSRKTLAETAINFLDEVLKRPGAATRFAYERAMIAVLGTCSYKDVKKHSKKWYFADVREAIGRVLSNRQPDWADDWVGAHIGAVAKIAYSGWFLTSYFLPFETLREIIRSGTCQRPQAVSYLNILTDGLARTHPGENCSPPRPIIEELLDHLDFLDDVFRCCEEEVTMFWAKGEAWADALNKLVELGKCDRQRLVDASLRPFRIELSTNGIAGYLKFAKTVCVSPEERAARQAVTRDLLSHRATSVVGFALDELALVEKENALGIREFLAAARPVFDLKPKGHPLAVLSMASRVVARDSSLVPEVAELALVALGHEAPEVQSKALTILEERAGGLHRDHTSELRDRIEGLAASLRGRAQAFITKLGGEATFEEASQVVTLQNKKDASDLAERAAETSAHWRKVAGVDEALAALGKRKWPAAIEFHFLDVPVLSIAQPISPIASLEQLFDLAAQLIEGIPSSKALEQFLDGVSRMADQRPANFELRAAPLLHRLQPLEGYAGRFQGQRSLHGLIPLLFTWLRGIAITEAPRNDYEDFEWPILRFLSDRIREITNRVVERTSAPLLAAPTHEGGWVAPEVLVERLRRTLEQGFQPGPFDLAQAILRMAPDGRNAALSDVREEPGNHWAVLRWALGHHIAPLDRVAENDQLWQAATATRAPQAVGNSPQPIAYRWQPVVGVNSVNGWDYSTAIITIEPAIECAGDPSLESRPMPTRLASRGKERILPYCRQWQIEWLAEFWPINVDALMAEAARAFAARLEMSSARDSPNFAFLRPLLFPDCPWPELAYVAVGVALVGKDQDSRQAAIDAMVMAITDGRADSSRVADVLARLQPGGWLKPNRLSEALREIARVSLLHVGWVAESLERFFLKIESWPSDGHHFLSLLTELLAELGEMPSEQMTVMLSALKPTGKSAKLATQLGKLQHAPNPQRADVLYVAVESRIARAERWGQAAGE